MLSSLQHSSPHPPSSCDIGGENACYQFGPISRETAEQILFDLGCIDGMFLIRESTATDSVLSLCHNQSILHYRISRIPSTGQVILHGTPIQVFPDFDTLIVKVQGLPTKPTLICDRNEVNNFYSTNTGGGSTGTIRHPPPTQPPPPQPLRRLINQPVYGSQESFYGTHMHIHVKHHQHQHHQHYTTTPTTSNNNFHTLNNKYQSHFNQLNSRSNSMWRIPLPEIKEAIIQKTKELGDDLVYGSTQIIPPPSLPPSLGQKSLSSNDKATGNDIQLSTVVLQPTSATDAGATTQAMDGTKLSIQQQGKGAENATLVSNMEIGNKEGNASQQKQNCLKCHRRVFFSDSSSTSTLEKPTTTSKTTEIKVEEEGLACRGCLRVIHFSCDRVSLTDATSLRKVSHRYVCSSCLDLLTSSLKETCHSSSTPQLLLLQQRNRSSGSSSQDKQSSIQEESTDDGGDSKGLTRDNEATMPSKEEMKQMIKEVVDDVIRTTITQVMSERVGCLVPTRVAGCTNCSCSESGDSGETNLKTMPSVLTLDKAAEEESKKASSATKTEDLLRLLKSPDVEVKNFTPILNCKSSSNSSTMPHSHAHPLRSSTATTTSSSKQHPPSARSHPGDRIISSEEIELKKKEILDLLKAAETHSTTGSSVTNASGAAVRPSNLYEERKEERTISGKRGDSHDTISSSDKRLHGASDSKDEKVKTGGTQQDEDEEDDSGEYESIRFEREDLEPKSCLGFASLPLDPLVVEGKEGPHDSSKTTSGTNDRQHNHQQEEKQHEQGSNGDANTVSSNLMPIQLNEVDLICLEDENQEKIQEMVRIYKKGPVSIDAKYINLKGKIGSGFFGDVFLATIPLRSSQLPLSSSSSSSASSSSSSSSGTLKKPLTVTATSTLANSENERKTSTLSSNNNQCNYIQVAVKVLKDSSLFNSRTELTKEASLMATLDHKHIIRLIGIACEEQSPKSPFMMVLELAPLGPFNTYLQSAVGRNTLSTRDILVLMLQVSMGMQYLESKHYIHRDLAARNVLLVNESFAKISDFGMSRALGLGKDYYKAKAGSKWPLKWFAPESIYYFKFSSKSDVWAYGVTLWEALSYGARPYDGMDSAQILRFLNDKQRLHPPHGTPEPIQDLLTRCWAYRPEERPSFAQIVQSLTCYLFLPSTSSGATG